MEEKKDPKSRGVHGLDWIESGPGMLWPELEPEN